VSVEIAVSYGELFDKISILEIKRSNVVNPDQRVNIENELEVLNRARATAIPDHVDVNDLMTGLSDVNARLWDVEDELRDCERRNEFGATFVELARSVYRLNDRRADLKRELNQRLGSELTEEKLYNKY
jgi:hypothetical protein